MDAEVTTDGFDKVGQLALVATTFGYQMGHLAAWFLPGEVGVLEFCSAEVSAKYGEEHGD